MSFTNLHVRPGVTADDLLAHGDASPATEVLNNGLMMLDLDESPVGGLVYSGCRYHIPTTAVSGVAFVTFADGSPAVLYNSGLAVGSESADELFVLESKLRSRLVDVGTEAVLEYLTGQPAEVSVVIDETLLEAQVRPLSDAAREILEDALSHQPLDAAYRNNKARAELDKLDELTGRQHTETLYAPRKVRPGTPTLSEVAVDISSWEEKLKATRAVGSDRTAQHVTAQVLLLADVADLVTYRSEVVRLLLEMQPTGRGRLFVHNGDDVVNSHVAAVSEMNKIVESRKASA